MHSHIRDIIEHLIKLQYSPADRPHRAWRRSIRNSRVEADVRLQESPSLRPQLDDIIADETERGARLAIAALEERGEVPAALAAELRAKSCREVFAFSAERLLGDWLPVPQGCKTPR